MVTSATLRTFRFAATLVDVAPGVRIRIGDGEQALAVVSWDPPGAADGEGVRHLPPYSFRAAVAHLQRMQRDGMKITILDLPEDREPTLDVELRGEDDALPGQLYRVQRGDEEQLLFMTELTSAGCARTFADAGAGGDERPSAGPGGGEHSTRAGEPVEMVPAAFWRRVQVHVDGVTRISVVHVTTARAGAEEAARLMERIMEICVAAEMVAEIEGTAPTR